MLLILASLLGTADAAGQIQPYMNGIGVSASTMIIPQKYPVSFPNYKIDGEKTDIDMEEVKGDLALGFKGALYISKDYRATVNPYYHASLLDGGLAGYRAMGIDVGVDKTLLREKNVLAFGGVNLGAASMTFDQTSQSKGILTANRLYIQAQTGATYFNRKSAYELAVFARIGNTGIESYILGDQSYDEEDLSGGVYSLPMIGLQGTYYYGDFRAIHKNGKKGKKGKKKGGKK